MPSLLLFAGILAGASLTGLFLFEMADSHWGRAHPWLRGGALLLASIAGAAVVPAMVAAPPWLAWTMIRSAPRVHSAVPHGVRAALSALAVLAPAPVDAGGHPPLVAFRLAGHAGAHAGEGAAAGFGDLLAAFGAFVAALAHGHAGAGREDGVLHRIVDLILHRAVARPAAGHDSLFHCSFFQRLK